MYVYTSADAESSLLTYGDYTFYCDDDGNYYLVRYNGSETELTLPTFTINGETVNYSIYKYAFYSNKKITSITISDNVTSIGGGAFSYCTSLESIIIPDSVTSIGEWAFSYCTSLTSITVDSSNTVYKSVDGNLYSYDGTELIQYAAGKTDTSFVIPDGVTSIDSFAFYGCTSLESITIPDSVISIGSYASWACPSFTSVYYNGTAEDWDEILIGSNNSYLTSAAIYYYSETQPEDDGNYWHYDTEGNIATW